MKGSLSFIHHSSLIIHHFLPMPNFSYISPKAQVRESPIHGRGLFGRETLKEMPEWYRAAEIQLTEDLFVGPLFEEEREGSMIFSNHSCEPNIGVRGQIVFVAMRPVEAGEELTHDWATTDDDDYQLDCRCGASTCRKVITGQDWRRP